MTDTATQDRWALHWPVVAATFIMAFFAWGAIFYAHGVFKVGLEQSLGWPSLTLSLAQSWFWTVAAVAAFVVGRALDRFGPRRIALYGTTAAGIAIFLVGHVNETWQLFAVYGLLATAYGPIANLGISAALAPLFTQKFAVALSIALTGASVGGALITPLFVAGMQHYGFLVACMGLSLAVVVCLYPIVFLLPDRGQPHKEHSGRGEDINAFATRQFWAIAVTASLTLFAQVGFLFHQISILIPDLGVGGAGYAVSVTVIAGAAGRFILGWAASRYPVTHAAAGTYLVQMAGMLAVIVADGPVALYLACALVGSAVGAIVMLPGMLTRNAFGANGFGRIFGAVNTAMFVGAPLGPGVGGIIADTAGYNSAIALFAGLLCIAALTVLFGARN